MTGEGLGLAIELGWCECVHGGYESEVGAGVGTGGEGAAGVV